MGGGVLSNGLLLKGVGVLQEDGKSVIEICCVGEGWVGVRVRVSSDATEGKSEFD